MSICFYFEQVFDEDVGQDKMLGIAKLPLIDLVSETMKELDLALLPSLDMLKFKDKKDRGSLKIKVGLILLIVYFDLYKFVNLQAITLR